MRWSSLPSRLERHQNVLERQQLRMRRFSMAASSALVTFFMLTVLYSQGLVEPRTFVGGVGAMVMGLVAFFTAFKTGWNLKAKDPSLTGPMMLMASAIVLWMMYDSPTVRATLGPYLCVIILFGVFRFPTRFLLGIALGCLGIYLLILIRLWLIGQRGPDMALDIGRLTVMACVLPLLAWVGGQINSLRQRLHDRKVFFQSIWDTCNDAVVVIDPQGVIRYTNPAMHTIFGRDPDQATGLHVSVLQDAAIAPAQKLENATMVANDGEMAKTSWETEGIRADGTCVPLAVTLSRTRLDRMDMRVVFLSDITKRKMAEEQIRHLAHHDPLTGLPNRTMMKGRLEEALANVSRQGGAVWILFLDFDRFKLINDSLGHRCGDVVLTTLAARMMASCRTTDTVARLGGDEFVMVLTELPGARLNVGIIERLMAELARPVHVDGQELLLTASIGIAAYPDDGTDADSLIEHADIAMYRAKQNGRNNFCFYTRSMNDSAIARQKLESSLRSALKRGEFRLLYQPQFDVASGNIISAEALLRWEHPERGLVSPADFIPVAEETGIIVPIGEWVMRTACTQHRRWIDEGLGLISVSVNLSPVQFAQEDLVDTVADILRETSIAPGSLELELTESMVMQDIDHAVIQLGKLKALGVRLSIDDFGTGYSSLAYLKRFPIDVLKIDKSFVQDLGAGNDCVAIVTAIITLAKALRLQVVAEGVELQEQFDQLRIARCDRVQGFLLSRPLAPGAFEELLLQTEHPL